MRQHYRVEPTRRHLSSLQVLWYPRLFKMRPGRGRVTASSSPRHHLVGRPQNHRVVVTRRDRRHRRRQRRWDGGLTIGGITPRENGSACRIQTQPMGEPYSHLTQTGQDRGRGRNGLPLATHRYPFATGTNTTQKDRGTRHQRSINLRSRGRNGDAGTLTACDPRFPVDIDPRCEIIARDHLRHTGGCGRNASDSRGR